MIPEGGDEPIKILAKGSDIFELCEGSRVMSRKSLIRAAIFIAVSAVGCGGGSGNGGGGGSSASGILYIKHNDSGAPGDPTAVTRRYDSASQIDGDVAPSATIEGAFTGQRHTNAAAAMVVEEDADRLWFTTGGDQTSSFAGIIFIDNISSASGNTSASGAIGGRNTGFASPSGLALDSRRQIIYASENSVASLRVFHDVDTRRGNVAPSAVISGPMVNLNSPLGLFVDEDRDVLYLADEGDAAIKIFENASQLTTGDRPPDRLIQGSNTNLVEPRSVFLDTRRNLLYVGDPGSSSILVFANGRTVHGNVAPVRTVKGGATQLGGFFDMTVNPRRNEIYVANPSPPSILVFESASAANGNIAPDRVVTHSDLTTDPPNTIAIDTSR